MTISAQRGGDFTTSNKVHSGKVATIHKKGFAFFTDDESDEEYFCPPNLVQGFKEKDTVEYQVSTRNDGRTAVKEIVSVNGEKKLKIGRILM